jgi:hypothetical protein
MAQGGLLGNGCKVAYATGSPQTWVAIPYVTDVVFPQFVADRVNIDTHSTTNNLHKNMAGLVDVTDPSFECLSDFDPSTGVAQQALLAGNKAGTTFWFRFELPVNAAKTSFRGCEFSATVGGFEPATPIGDKQTTRFSLQFNGLDVGWDTAAGASEIS